MRDARSLFVCWTVMAACRGSSSKWFFTREQLENTPSRRCGVEPDRELSYRQQAANLIQDMGQRLNVSQLTINTAIVYMHRFYMYHSFSKFHRNTTSPTALFLAAKVEEQPRKLEHVIKVTHACLNPQEPPLDTKSNAYLQQAQELVILETIVLQTLGFEITIEHPHTDVVKCSQLVRASKDLAQTSYFMATNSLHLTTFCLQYKPTVIACVCIHLACKWSNWEIPVSTDGKHWWEYVDNSVTLELLDELTHEFLQILEKTPSRLKRIRNWRATQAAKKPKSDGQASDSSSLAGPSLTQDMSLMDALPGVSTNTAFSKASTSFPVTLPSYSSSSLSLDSIGNMQGTSYTYTAPSDWPQDQVHSDQYSVKQLPPYSSMHPHRPDKCAELNPAKHEHKASGGAKHQATTYPPPAAPTQKMSLDKYREKHAGEMAVQKRRQEQQNVETEVYGAPTQTDHRKHLPQLSHGQQGAGATTASPLKMKLPVPGQDKLQDKREKGSSLKLRLPVPSQSEKEGSSKEELKMKIKVSSERHSSSDEGAAKSKHSSPLVSKEKHRDHSAHRHHHKHGHSHTHTHSGNGRSSLEVPASGSALRSPVGSSGDGTSSASSSSRKRVNPDASHNHHSKKNKSSKGGAGGLRTSQHPSETGQETSGEPWP
ncbi:cyclin-T2-like isoform X2 [Sinocyclocheilus rhinocerous]|uniref:2-amino-3-carboxymuconate-6-semialdehyde decarboxylase-like n=1 Tax=Sinocyclocheilus rhinocerous TaxID=307959 RepID=A0A673KRD2_9TELE|nr:PREDICTED: cyclin-T2-like isoform X2 [Sinocyclocheilus rhinocerous]